MKIQHTLSAKRSVAFMTVRSPSPLNFFCYSLLRAQNDPISVCSLPRPVCAEEEGEGEGGALLTRTGCDCKFVLITSFA